MKAWNLCKPTLLAALIAIASTARADSGETVCTQYETLIESALKEAADHATTLGTADLDAYLSRSGPPSVAQPALLAAAWARIHAAIAHMPQLGCKPYPHTLDPSAYYAALFKCRADKSKERQSCRRSSWERKAWSDHRE